MKEKLQEYALIAEIVSGVAVVVTILILIISIQRNTEITRAVMFADLQRDFATLEMQAFSDPHLNDVFEAWLTMDTADLTDQDKRLVRRIVVSTARNYDTAFSMRNSGLLGPNEWEKASRYICTSRSRAISAGLEETWFALISNELRDYVESTCIN